MSASTSESSRELTGTGAGMADSASVPRHKRLGAFDLTDDLLRRRVKARAVDMGLALGPVAVLQAALALFFRLVAEDWGGPQRYFDFSDMGLVLAYFYLTCVLVPLLPTAVVVVEVIGARKNGQTQGKVQAGICVRHVLDSGVLSVPTTGRTVARAAVLYVPPAVLATVAYVLYVNELPGSFAVLGVMAVYVLGAIVPVFTSRRRGLHDLLACTVVVLIPSPSAVVQPRGGTNIARSGDEAGEPPFSLRLAFRGLWKRRRR